MRRIRIGLFLVFTIGAFAGPLRPAPTFTQDVAPILYQNCVLCHRPGEVAPFSLLTYQDAAKRAALLAEVTRKRIMPPWHADDGPVPFRHARRLTDGEIDFYSDGQAQVPHKASGRRRQSRSFIRDGKLANRIW